MSRKTKEEKLAELAAIEAAQKAEREKFLQELPAKILYEFIPKLLERGIEFSFTPNQYDSDGRVCINFGGDWIPIKNLEKWEYESYFDGFISEWDRKREEANRRANIRKMALNKLTDEEKKELGLK